MWLNWTRSKITERPACWWEELERAQRPGLVFAHLFPRPPRGRRPATGEAHRLVKELVRTRPEEGMEEIVNAYRKAPPGRRWEQVEPWQILSVQRLDTAELERWGADGGQVLEWFDKGELLSAWPVGDPAEPLAEPPARGLARALSWLKSLLTRPESLDLANAEG